MPHWIFIIIFLLSNDNLNFSVFLKRFPSKLLITLKITAMVLNYYNFPVSIRSEMTPEAQIRSHCKCFVLGNVAYLSITYDLM